MKHTDIEEVFALGNMLETSLDVCHACEHPHGIMLFRTELPTGEFKCFEVALPPVDPNNDSLKQFIKSLSEMHAYLLGKVAPSIGDVN